MICWFFFADIFWGFDFWSSKMDSHIFNCWTTFKTTVCTCGNKTFKTDVYNLYKLKISATEFEQKTTNQSKWNHRFKIKIQNMLISCPTKNPKTNNVFLENLRKLKISKNHCESVRIGRLNRSIELFSLHCSVN